MSDPSRTRWHPELPTGGRQVRGPGREAAQALRRRRGSPLALAVLVCLDRRAMYPYEVVKSLRRQIAPQGLSLSDSSLYSSIGSLARQGFIAAQYVTSQGRRPERTVYAITENGRAEMRDWLARIVRDPAEGASSFGIALWLMPALPPGEALQLLEQRAERLQAEISQASAALRLAESSRSPRLLRLDAEYSELLLETEHTFVRLLIADMAGAAEREKTGSIHPGLRAVTNQ